MVDLVEGKSVDEAMHLADTFHRLMESRGKGLDDEHAEEELEDGIVFQGVSKYPMRIKCALLGWEGMKELCDTIHECGYVRNADDKPAPEAIIYSTALSVSVMERQ